jgi:phage-related protein
MFDVDYYDLPNGEKPVEKFIDSLEIKMRAKALGSIDILAKFGHTLREPYSKSMGGGLFELRIKYASDITRIFYFFVVDNKIILTNGFVKKTQKTPPSEIALAKKYKADYEGRITKK